MEKEGEETRKHALLIKTAGMKGTGFHVLKYLSVGSTRARRGGCAGRELKNSVKKGSPFWDPSIEGERAREP